jgi:peptidoglycan-associated lipoprotein
MRKWIIAAFIIAALAGCKSTDTQNPAPVEDGAPAATAPAAGGATTAPVGTAGVSGTPAASAGAAALKDPNNILSKRNIYFDYDQFVIKDEYRPIIEAHAKYLQANKQARATLQGNTDERGTREYNIALGQKRADSVKKLMILLGASEIQVETVSFGKEKPRREGHDETSWAENRRADIVYVGE